MNNTPNYPQGQGVPVQQQGANSGGFAVALPPPAPKASSWMAYKFTAGGGLVAGIVAGLVLISGGSSTSNAEGGGEEVAVATPKKAETYGDDLADTATQNQDGDEAKSGEGAEAAAPEQAPAEAEEAADGKPEEALAESETAPAAEASEPKLANLKFDVSPESAYDNLRVELDGKEVDWKSAFEVDLGTGKKAKRVKLVAKAEGFRDFRKTLSVQDDMNVEILLKEKPAKRVASSAPKASSSASKLGLGASTKSSQKPKKKKKKKKKGPGGLISL